MLDFMWGLKEEKRVLILTAWWLWWNNRNKLREGELPAGTSDIARRARAMVFDYAEAFKPPDQKHGAKDIWMPPGEDMIKINLDGSFVTSEDFAGWGVVARTADGSVVGARAEGRGARRMFKTPSQRNHGPYPMQFPLLQTWGL